MGTQKSVSGGELPAGSAFYVAVRSRDNTGVSQFSNVASVIMGSYPIASDVFTTLQKTVSPVALSLTTPQISPSDISLYDIFGYSAWQEGPGLPLVKRTDIMPTGYSGASVTNTGRLLNFFAITDIHITDKESPAQVIYSGLSAPFGAGGLSFGAYSPIISYTTQSAGLNKSIPWYQVIGNHDQYFTGLYRESDYIRSIHVGDTIFNFGLSFASPSPLIHGYYMGVVDGSTPDGDIRGAGPEAYFATPPKVAADPGHCARRYLQSKCQCAIPL